MSGKSEFERYRRDLSTNEALRTAARAAGPDRLAIVKLGNSKGYEFGLADVEIGPEDGELAASDLAAVAGGMLHGDGGGWSDSSRVHRAEPAPPLTGGSSTSSTGSSSGGSSGGGGTQYGRPPRHQL